MEVNSKVKRRQSLNKRPQTCLIASNQDVQFGDAKCLSKILNAPSENLIEEDSVVELFKSISWSDLGSPSENERVLGTPSKAQRPMAIDNFSIQQKMIRDYNSPSAASRCRAIRAMHSETKRMYNYFDVPHEEQDIITADERKSPPKAQSIQEVMHNVCVYVEVRTGEDNRTAGIQKIVAALGARVHERIQKTTTHVIFKDGLWSNYSKAKRMNIPIVSILWIDACKRNMKIMEASLFPIGNIERYENPELYKKIRRQKSMQPGAVDRMKVMKKSANEQLTTSTKTTNRSVPSVPRLKAKKDGLAEMLSDFQNKILSTPDSELNSRPLLLLEKIRNSPAPNAEKRLLESMTRINSVSEMSSNDSNVPSDLENRESTKGKHNSDSDTYFCAQRKTIISVNTPRATNKQQPETPINTRRVTRRSSLLMQQRLLQQTDSTSTTSDEDNIQKVTEQMSMTTMNNMDTRTKPIRQKTPNRRRTIFTPLPAEKIVEEELTPTNIIIGQSCPQRLQSQITTESDSDTIHFEVLTPTNSVKSVDLPSPKPRKTVYSPKAMDQSTFAELTSTNVNGGKEFTNRRTLYTPQPMEQTKCYSKDVATTPILSTNKAHRRRKTVAFVLDCEEKGKENAGSTVPSLPDHRRRTIFEGSVHNLQKKTEILTPYTACKTGGAVKPLTIEEEYDQSQTNDFDSSRAPNSNKRKSMNDKIREILDKKIESVNTSSKRLSLATTTAAAFCTPKKVAVEDVEKLGVDIGQNQSQQSKIDMFFKSQKKTTPQAARTTKTILSTDDTTSDFQPDSTIVTKSKPVPKKRKLYKATNENMTTLVTLNTAAKKLEEKSLPANKNRRQTMSVLKSSNSDSDFVNPPPRDTETKKDRRSSSVFDVTKSLAYVNRQPKPPPPPQKITGIVCSNLSSKEILKVAEVVKKLGKYRIQTDISRHTSHLVTKGDGVDYKILHAINRGVWIVTFKWVIDSELNNRWQPEDFNLFKLTLAAQSLRGLRETSGNSFTADVLESEDFYYVSSTCDEKAKLKKLIVAAGGTLTDTKGCAKYMITTRMYPPHVLHSAALQIGPQWIKDCVFRNTFLNTKLYRIK